MSFQVSREYSKVVHKSPPGPNISLTSEPGKTDPENSLTDTSAYNPLLSFTEQDIESLKNLYSRSQPTGM